MVLAGFIGRGAIAFGKVGSRTNFRYRQDKVSEDKKKLWWTQFSHGPNQWS